MQPGRLRVERTQRLPDLADFAPCPGGGHLCNAGTSNDQRSSENERRVVAAGARAPFAVELELHDLPDRRGFAGEQRFVGEQVVGFEERCVRRNAIAFGQNDHVAARHFPARYPLALAVADDERAGTRQVS